ncbi:MAG: hypothetical protein JNN16_01445 [Nitrospira sp.]|nr:hypothetical protein [Nitrospira sp.]
MCWYQFKNAVGGLLLVMVVSLVSLSTTGFAQEFGGIKPGKLVLGFRAGFTPLTQ